jgi:hypothetical protein
VVFILRLMYTAPMTEASHPEARIADALPDHWADRVLPGWARPYARLMRLERPIGWWLLLLPCWWGLCLGQIAVGVGLPSPWYAFLFLAGAIIMRGAGCTLNDIADRNFDGRVERTRLRPIPAGQVSVKQAFAFLVLLCLLGLVILCQLCAAAPAPVAGLAAVATSSPDTFAVAAVGTAATAALANARRDGGGCRSQSSGSRKSRKAKAGTFPSLRRPRAGFQRSVPCKPLGVTRAGDSPASSSKPVPRSGTYPACGRAGSRCFFPYSLLAVRVRAGARTN